MSLFLKWLKKSIKTKYLLFRTSFTTVKAKESLSDLPQTPQTPESGTQKTTFTTQVSTMQKIPAEEVSLLPKKNSSALQQAYHRPYIHKSVTTKLSLFSKTNTRINKQKIPSVTKTSVITAPQIVFNHSSSEVTLVIHEQVLTCSLNDLEGQKYVILVDEEKYIIPLRSSAQVQPSGSVLINEVSISLTHPPKEYVIKFPEVLMNKKFLYTHNEPNYYIFYSSGEHTAILSKQTNYLLQRYTIIFLNKQWKINCDPDGVEYLSPWKEYIIYFVNVTPLSLLTLSGVNGYTKTLEVKTSFILEGKPIIDDLSDKIPFFTGEEIIIKYLGDSMKKWTVWVLHGSGLKIRLKTSWDTHKDLIINMYQLTNLLAGEFQIALCLSDDLNPSQVLFFRWILDCHIETPHSLIGPTNKRSPLVTVKLFSKSMDKLFLASLDPGIRVTEDVLGHCWSITTDLSKICLSISQKANKNSILPIVLRLPIISIETENNLFKEKMFNEETLILPNELVHGIPFRILVQPGPPLLFNCTVLLETTLSKVLLQKQECKIQKNTFIVELNSFYETIKTSHENTSVYLLLDTKKIFLFSFGQGKIIHQEQVADDPGTAIPRISEGVLQTSALQRVQQQSNEHSYPEVAPPLNYNALIVNHQDKDTHLLNLNNRPDVQSLYTGLRTLFRDYQTQALDAWINNKRRGIAVMATGTGKTLIGVGAILYTLVQQETATIILITVPKIHLIHQWTKELQTRGLYPIICSSQEPDWSKTLRNKLLRLKLEEYNFIILITTLNTFIRKKFQKYLTQLSAYPVLLICDEAHNIGAEKTKHLMPDFIHYRLALTATPEIWFNLEGTGYIYYYFSKIIFEFSLTEAIKQGYLVPYNYDLQIVFLTDEEVAQYDELSGKFHALNQFASANHHNNRNRAGEKTLFSEKSLAYQRRQIIVNAQQKLDLFSKRLDQLKNQTHVIIFCSPKQFADVGNLLHKNGLTYRSLKYNNHTLQERQEILQSFSRGKIPILVVMNILDEGVDIPPVNMAIFLASSTNPREFIQRRGRILRPYRNKAKATIIDYLVLPPIKRLLIELETNEPTPLIASELARVYELSMNSLNKVEVLQKISETIPDLKFIKY